ncbi:MAG: outer membrane protein assembly factor BamB family protein, partial [Planctomycetota bacterium]
MKEIRYVGRFMIIFPCALFACAGRSSAHEILEATGVSGGLVVHVGCGDGRLTAALRADDGYLVQGLDTDPAEVREARRHVASLGVYGEVTADTFDGKQLPYTDNLVNLLVVSEGFAVSKDEMARVLAPGGVAYVREGGRWRKTVKPWPDDVDEWTHYLHGPDNNAVAHDTVVGPPRHMQWLAAPEWNRSHHKLASISSVVTAGGRLFYILDEAPAANFNVPSQWVIVARDAFSGVTLWKKPIESWAWHQIRFRSGPPQVTRLLVTSGDRLYAPLGLNAPVSAVDAVTGETLNTFESTAGAEEIILVEGVLLALKGSPVAEQAFAHAAFREAYKLPNEKSLVAVDVENGKTLWTWSNPEVSPMPETLGSDGKRVYLQIGEGVACLDLKSGGQLWTFGDTGRKTKRKGVTFGTNNLVVADGVVLCKLADALTALDAADGTRLWECPAGGGFHAPVDVFVIGGLVWQGNCVGDSISPPPVKHFSEGRDLRTGRIVATNDVAVDLQTPGHHHRCYREKATDRFIITGKRGIEMMDLAGGNHTRDNWVRGTCQYGVLPANGLMYAPSHACGCYMESKLRGFWALAADRPASGRKRAAPDESRLEKGPAYEPRGSEPGRPRPIADAGDWPMYRHDPLRSGVATTVLPTELEQAWKAPIGGRLTQPVVAGGMVVLASVDAHTVYALDAKSGQVVWKHVAGGRVDSPPAVDRGTVLFGSADGRVTCLRLRDGELIWRFLAAPADVRAVAFDRVESLWPVHGSVLVLDGVAYCSAGRSTWIDGGIDLLALDPATGKVLAKTRFRSDHPEYGEGKEKAAPEHETRIDQNLTDYKTFLAPDRSDAFSMAGGSVSDVLVSNGNDVFLHHVRFSAKLEKRDDMSRHLFSTSSLLDGAESHRSHWVLGTGDFSRVPVAYSWIVNRPGKR